MTPRERLGLGLVRRMLARLSLAARVQELEAELHAAREEIDQARVAVHALRNSAQTAELERARAAHRAEQMEREAVALRTRMEQAERDAEDLRRLEEAAEARTQEAQTRARMAEQERDEAQRLLEAARAELRARGAADHEPPRGASPLDAVARVPNLRRHDWSSPRPGAYCRACGVPRSETMTAGAPCPGPKEAS